MSENTISIKRIYAIADEQDGIRVLVDRLWPRGISKQAAKIDLWPKAITPSNALRKWYHAHKHEEATFKIKYQQEMEGQRETISELLDLIDQKK